MARVKNNQLTQALSGQINKQIVFETYGDKTFVSTYPNRENVKFTALQKTEQGIFAEAILYARSIINDPEKKAAFKRNFEPGRRVYNAAISEYLKEQKKNNR